MNIKIFFRICSCSLLSFELPLVADEAIYKSKRESEIRLRFVGGEILKIYQIDVSERADPVI